MASDEWTWGQGIEIKGLDYLAAQRDAGLPGPRHLELLIQYRQKGYTAIIDDEPEVADIYGGRWQLGLSTCEAGARTQSLLDDGIETFRTLDEAIASTLLTIIACAGRPPGTWQAVRLPDQDEERPP